MAAPATDAILYACVVNKEKTILADCTYRHSATTTQVTSTVRAKIIPLATSPNYTHARNSFSNDDVLFHIARKSDVIFICVTTSQYAAYMSFNFLDKISSTFLSFYKDPEQRNPSVCQPFVRMLRQEGDFFNSPDANKLAKVRSQIDDVKNVMMENLDAVIQRGDKIENLVDKSSTLLDESHSFVTNSTSLKRKMRWRQIKIILAIILLVAVIITVIVLIACQGFKKDNRCQN
jgi:vesicle-associated membrane protein 7